MDIGKLNTVLEEAARTDAAAMIVRAKRLRDEGKIGEAVESCRAAMAQAPADGWIKTQAQRIIAWHVPAWHFGIFADHVRNDAYEAAIRRAVTPGARVFEIGTGSGLLSMMAMRAGAASVVTCEADVRVAEVARKILARNGFADRVKVLAKHSDEVTLTDLGGPADVIVSELLSSNLIGDNVLPAHEKAVRELTHSGTKIIPARGMARIALIHDSRQDGLDLKNVSGFDVSEFASLADPLTWFSVTDSGVALKSEPQDLFAFDFATPHYCPPQRTSIVCQSSGGPVNGVALWIKLELDDSVSYENCPHTGYSHWDARIFPFYETLDTKAGDEIHLGGGHDRKSILLWRQDQTGTVL